MTWMEKEWAILNGKVKSKVLKNCSFSGSITEYCVQQVLKSRSTDGLWGMFEWCTAPEADASQPNVEWNTDAFFA